MNWPQAGYDHFEHFCLIKITQWITAWSKAIWEQPISSMQYLDTD